MLTYYTRKESHAQIGTHRARSLRVPRLSIQQIPGANNDLLLPGVLALFFVMFERRIQTADYFRGRFE